MEEIYHCIFNCNFSNEKGIAQFYHKNGKIITYIEYFFSLFIIYNELITNNMEKRNFHVMEKVAY